MLNPTDRKLIRRDREIPGLATVLDAPSLLRRLDQVWPLTGAEARISYVRYKPTTNCLAAYHVTAGKKNLVFVAKAHRRDEWPLRRAAHLREAVGGQDAPGNCAIDELAITISPFPQDRVLRALGRLHDCRSRGRLLERLLPTPLGATALETLAYKPERRYVGRVVASGKPIAVVKLYSAVGYERARRTSKAFDSRTTLRVPDRLGRSRRYRAVSFGWCVGDGLHELIRQSKVCPAEGIESLATSIAELHQRSTNRLRLRSREEIARSILSVQDYTARLCPQLGEMARQIAQRLLGRLSRESEFRRPIHGDLYAKQVVVQSAGVVILDFDSAVLCDPASDLGNFIAHLEGDALLGRISSGRSAALRDRLLAGYAGVAGDRRVLSRVPLQIAISLFKLVPHPFRRREPNWPERTAAILRRADELLPAGRSKTVYPVSGGRNG